MEANSSIIHTVTGAFGNSGSVLARTLLDRDLDVRTLTNRAGTGHPLAARIRRAPLCFEDRGALTESLAGTRVLYNTFWIRFSKAGFRIRDGVGQSRLLFECARDAGVERIVHVSITHPSATSPYEYFRGKAAVEEALAQCGVPHTILRPAVLFGGEDILLENIAWALRRLPVFGLFGSGEYRLQPVHLEDLAELALQAGLGDPARPSEVLEALGPEVYSYRELVEMLRDAMGVRCSVIAMPRRLALAGVQLIGRLHGDVTLTDEEVGALMDELLVGSQPARGTRSLRAWAHGRSESLGRRYLSELSVRIAGCG